jgi:Leucine-rich repeat (LRR) protein
LINNLGNLQEQHLGEVNISTSPTDLAHASSTNTTSGLEELTMWLCTITSGRLDTVLTKLPFLSKLILGVTDISGPTPVPEHFVDFSSLAILNLYSCGLTGTFPSWIFRIKSLMSLDVSANKNLRGELAEFIEGSALQELRLAGTKFSGKIPESIGSLQNLTMLDLNNCLFYGLIPLFAQWSMIRWVDLSSNNLTGSLPSDGYLSLHNLNRVYLSNNSISGAIPASLFSHPFLEYLYLSQNNFTGNFLLHPNISSSLREIDVSFNKLQGPLPNLLSKFLGLE